MSAPSAVVRTAPIAIAPKPPRFPPSRQISIHLDPYPSLRNGIDSPDSDSPSGHSAAIPCESCVRQRRDCVMSDEEESCIACLVSGTDCSLRESPPPRKRKLNGEADDGNSKRSSPGRSDNRRRRHQQLSYSSTTASSSLIEEMANFGGPTLLKRTLGLQSDRYSQYIGPTTDFEPSLINLSSFDPHDESLLTRGTLRRVSDNETFLMLPDYNTPGFEHVLDDVDEIERIVAPHSRQLIDLYFRVVHPGFPIIQKTVFFEKYERSYREFSPPLLAAIYILAINWWEHSEELASLPRPNVRELERLVRTTLADAMYRPKLSTIQAGLLLSQRPEGDQWAPTAQLVAIGQELGLHLDCSSWKIPPWEKGLRKRLAWSLYMQDKWGALVHGRPSHIFSSNWAVQALTQNDFPDVEWDESDLEERLEIERGRTLFVQMVQLSQILAEILETFYTLQATQAVVNAGPQGTQLVLSLAKPIQLKLKEWYGAIPAAIRMDSTFQSGTITARLSSIGYLHLAYFATEITLHRRIIRSIDGGVAVGATMDPYIQHICRSAAKARLISAMDFVNRLTPSHLRAFWYFASKTNFALIGTFGSLLWGTSPGREEAEWYRRRLGEYRWTLSVSSKPGEGKGLTEFAMGMLDITTGLLKQLPEKPLLSRHGSAVDIDAARRQSILALGGSTGGGFGGMGTGIGVGVGGSWSNLSGIVENSGNYGGDLPTSAEASNMHSPRSPRGGGGSESSDEGMYGFSATAGMAGMAD
ncbi:putative specific RNA polymerase II transcription factor [Lasiosphaeria miniovina]|uniref:Specific RNA polymerase II transcription factor n=1 Tax=Lasiosphaeria miniovina TaxID=1954250 RepID=A0AA40A5I0_9PEZI|nr:putative specific RNA polymerase II transcription factor [Lasiosphaeria miniovina]KAK0709689.1 putative specific RNA polymerase II transcription factor [Lasiosphaeria miniovina]